MNLESKNSIGKDRYRLFRFPLQDYLLFMEAFLWVLFCQVVSLMPFHRLAPFLGHHEADDKNECFPDNLKQTVSSISIAINRSAFYMPWSVKCLVQALAARFMLKRRKIESTLYLGVAKSAENRIKAHAWLSCGTHVVCGDQGKEKFKIISTFR